MEYIDKIVDFTYCKKCEYYNEKDYKDPCHSCLSHQTNTYSHKPVNFKEKESKKG